MKHVLRTADLTPREITVLVDLASELKRRPRRSAQELAGELVLIYLTEPSTRMRLTFSAAAEELGATVVLVGPAEFRRGWNADVEQLAPEVSQYAAVVVARTRHDNVSQLASLSSVPVVNALSEAHHPCQSLADLLALREAFGTLDGLSVAWVGEAGPATHSLMEACALAGIDLAVATPYGCEPDPEVVSRVDEIAAGTGSRVRTTHDPREAVVGADALYGGAWLRLGLTDEERAVRRAALWPARATVDLVRQAAPHAVFMQSAPVHPDDEVAPETAIDLRSVSRDQSANLHHAAGALLVALHQRRLNGADHGLVVA